MEFTKFFCLSGRSTTLLLKSQYQSCKILFASIIPCLQSLILANNEYAELLGFYKKPFTFLLLFFLFSTISYAPTKLTEIILFQHLFHNQLGKPSKKKTWNFPYFPKPNHLTRLEGKKIKITWSKNHF